VFEVSCFGWQYVGLRAHSCTYQVVLRQAETLWFNPPDVWVQLLRHLLRDAACRQALLKRSPAAAAAPAELMLAQLAVTLAEELYAKPDQ
jgi:hypothetical protein